MPDSYSEARKTTRTNGDEPVRATFLTKQEMLTSHNKPVMLNFTHTGAAACCYIE